ncbi:MAG: acyl carrier protein [Cellvibrionaceae bacterium]
MQHSQQSISQLMKNEISSILNVSPAQIDEHNSIDRFSLNSSSIVSLVGVLEEELDAQLSPSLFFEYPTIAEASKHLESELKEFNSRETA